MTDNWLLAFRRHGGMPLETTNNRILLMRNLDQPMPGTPCMWTTGRMCTVGSMPWSLHSSMYSSAQGFGDSPVSKRLDQKAQAEYPIRLNMPDMGGKVNEGSSRDAARATVAAKAGQCAFRGMTGGKVRFGPFGALLCRVPKTLIVNVEKGRCAWLVCGSCQESRRRLEDAQCESRGPLAHRLSAWRSGPLRNPF